MLSVLSIPNNVVILMKTKEKKNHFGLESEVFYFEKCWNWPLWQMALILFQIWKIAKAHRISQYLFSLTFFPSHFSTFFYYNSISISLSIQVLIFPDLFFTISFSSWLLKEAGSRYGCQTKSVGSITLSKKIIRIVF